MLRVLLPVEAYLIKSNDLWKTPPLVKRGLRASMPDAVSEAQAINKECISYPPPLALCAQKQCAQAFLTAIDAEDGP